MNDNTLHHIDQENNLITNCVSFFYVHHILQYLHDSSKDCYLKTNQRTTLLIKVLCSIIIFFRERYPAFLNKGRQKRALNFVGDMEWSLDAC